MSRSFISIDDLTNDEMEAVFQLADKFLEEMATGEKPLTIRGRHNLADKLILATLFFEPSTRTRLSFESAMIRLGGHCISSADSKQTSAAKGETIADTVRVVESYADAIVIRHPMEGAARVAADFARVPVINAGDGGHEHPTQTLCDLYTLRAAQADKGQKRSIKSLEKLNVVIWGDLQHGRTVHSLVYALARLKARIIPRAAPGCELPEQVTSRLARDYQCFPITKSSPDAADVLPSDLDVLYVTPEEPHQLALIADVWLGLSDKQKAEIKNMKTFDALYSTRLQRERLQGQEGLDYPQVNIDLLKERKYRDANVMHPLPRVDELSYEMDEDKRSVYFQQAAYGVPVRMALIAGLLELLPTLGAGKPPVQDRYRTYRQADGIECSNAACVTRNDSERRYLVPSFYLFDGAELSIRCRYCDVEQRPGAYGRLTTRKFAALEASWKSVPAEDLVLFRDEAQAREHKFEPRKEQRKRKSATVEQ